ncbi:MAG: hypothetical protein SAK29_31865 [Scytonema sp. PMC 1069.18]|nr:hypothetical protein [Scytonema sp. PMC 1069.18]
MPEKPIFNLWLGVVDRARQVQSVRKPQIVIFLAISEWESLNSIMKSDNPQDT